MGKEASDSVRMVSYKLQTKQTRIQQSANQNPKQKRAVGAKLSARENARKVQVALV